ncbi:MAG: GtrA family protein [Pseudomonadota bacterium]
MSNGRLAGLYIAFAVVATIVNLGVQRVVLAVDDGLIGFAAAVFCGTLAGLVVKYVLDKRYIFHDRRSGLAHTGKQFSAYTLMGVGTTLVFWGTETAFWLIWQTDLMREVGAVIGLAIGYTTKYHLDKRFVFNEAGGITAPRGAAS